MANPVCPKCRGEMEAGFLLLRGPRSRHIVVARAAVHAQPRRPSPSEGPGEAKGGILPDRHREFLCVAACALLGGVPVA